MFEIELGGALQIGIMGLKQIALDEGDLDGSSYPTAMEATALLDYMADLNLQLGSRKSVLAGLQGRCNELVAENVELRAKLDYVAPWSCIDCGPHIPVDEDGCCAICGRDAAMNPPREGAEGDE